MRIDVENIKVASRIRKLTAKIDELAQDIQKNGLINPITVMAVEGGYQLLAGLRRLRAVKSLGWTEIEATVAAPKDAEAALFIEHSENVQREAFTYSEKMDYARLIAEIEKAKALERKAIGGATAGRNRPQKVGDQGSQPNAERNPRVRDIVGSKIGMSGYQYDRAAYIANHAPQEIIDELDRGERNIRSTYEELRSIEKKPSEGTVKVQAVLPKPAQSTPEFIENAMPVSDLDRAIRAESELDAMKYRQHNEIYHRDVLIEHLKNRVAELEAALEAANARIQELEGGIPCKSGSLILLTD